MWEPLFASRADYDLFMERQIFKIVESKRKQKLNLRKKAERQEQPPPPATTATTSTATKIVMDRSGEEDEKIDIVWEEHIHVSGSQITEWE